ncbi:MAG: 50S ribosomal protein L17 [Bacteroidota bacterium]
MRHGKTINHLGRMAAHRDALLQNLAVSLIMNKRINTTVAKAKALRRYVEPIITRSKDDSMHNRRTAFSYLQDKHAVKELFATVGDKVANRPGGYTRIIRTGFRLGDAAEMCMIELVDFNELMLAESQSKKAKTRRSRSGKKSADSGSSTPVSAPSSVVAGAGAMATEPLATTEPTPAEEVTDHSHSEEVTGHSHSEEVTDHSDDASSADSGSADSAADSSAD